VTAPAFCAVVPAAGAATRMGAGRPKPRRVLAGRAVIEWALAPLLARPELTRLILALPPGEALDDWLAPPRDGRVTAVVGGDTRAASVARALEAGDDGADDTPVLVHDAARPCLCGDELERLLAHVDEPDGALLAVAVGDTLKRADASQRVAETVDRSGLWRALTPQGFPHARLAEALARAGGDVTDDASAIEAIGGAPRLVEGDPANIKITRPADLELAQAILQARRSGGAT
jgi:2-C-methyl-D-erythritol 4-phosphate cytidylyltransferase